MNASLKRWGAYVLALSAALQLSGCLVVDDDDEDAGPFPVGTLTLEWTLDGQQNGLDCVDFGADRLEVVIYDSTGAEVDELEPFCEDFALSVDLLEGRYFADVTLVDSFDRSATLTETIEAIDVIAGTDLNVEVDFPVGSFL